MAEVATIGNATIIAYENGPILSTDPWFCDEDPAYFGSWIGSHSIPNQYKEDILKSKFIWFSHGHPDHINPISLKRFLGKKIFLPDHYGSRIYKDLIAENFDVEILKDKKWYNLSENIKIQCVTNLLQDSILLIEVDKRLFINLNDAGTKYYEKYIKNLTKNYKENYLLSLSGYGDADMINFFSESGKKITKSKVDKVPPGKQLSDMCETIGANNIIPFSSFHQYQRADSVWAQSITVDNDEYKDGVSEKINFIEPFSIIDCKNGKTESIKPNKIIPKIKSPEEFGDNWADQLSKEDFEEIKKYFHSKIMLKKTIGFIRFIVGGKEHFIKFDNKLASGISFEVPRNSLVTTVRYKIFDDLLIGNFMKTTLHNFPNLYYKNFKYIIANWSDNGYVDTNEEFQEYIRIYKEKTGQNFLYYNFLDQSKNLFLRFISKNPNSNIYKFSKKIFKLIK